MTFDACSTQAVPCQRDPDEAPEILPASAIDLPGARKPSPAESDGIASHIEARRKIQGFALLRMPSHNQARTLDESLCWLIAAAVLGYLVLGIIAL